MAKLKLLFGKKMGAEICDQTTIQYLAEILALSNFKLKTEFLVHSTNTQTMRS